MEDKIKKFLRENKIVLTILIGALIIGLALYFGFQKSGGNKIEKNNEIEIKECVAPDEVIVTKVIDGDTIIVEGGEHIRLLGIDADENGYPCYKAAKKELEALVLNKQVRLEKDKTDLDQYGRCLRYIFVDNQNVDIQLVKEGLAVARFYAPDIKYREEITQAEKEAIDNKIGCKWSDASDIPLEEDLSINYEWQNLTQKKLGLAVIQACEADNHLGRELIIEGKIAIAYQDTKSNTVFLNFEKPYPNQCFTSVIFSSDLYKFIQNPEDYYSNKTVRVTGEVKEYQGKPEIILQNPNQIEVANN